MNHPVTLRHNVSFLYQLNLYYDFHIAPASSTENGFWFTPSLHFHSFLFSYLGMMWRLCESCQMESGQSPASLPFGAVTASWWHMLNCTTEAYLILITLGTFLMITTCSKSTEANVLNERQGVRKYVQHVIDFSLTVCKHQWQKWISDRKMIYHWVIHTDHGCYVKRRVFAIPTVGMTIQNSFECHWFMMVVRSSVQYIGPKSPLGV